MSPPDVSAVATPPPQPPAIGPGLTPPPPPTIRPSLSAIFACFFGIGLQSFGGGLSAWIRREVVRKRGWMEERPFLAGLALCQIAPGPNSMNMAVFIGTMLRGIPGALVAVCGLMLVPVVVTLGAGMLYFSGSSLPGLQRALAGAGAAAIGLILANGCQLTPRAVRNAGQACLMVFVAIGLGVTRMGLGEVLAVALPAGVVLAVWQERRPRNGAQR